jgi:hypothetical protein
LVATADLARGRREAWVNDLMLGTPVRGDFEHCEVAVFVGKNSLTSAR